jgi:hypothetical protein
VVSETECLESAHSNRTGLQYRSARALDLSRFKAQLHVSTDHFELRHVVTCEQGGEKNYVIDFASFAHRPISFITKHVRNARPREMAADCFRMPKFDPGMDGLELA